MDGDARVRVAAVSRTGDYTFSKPNQDEIVLVAGLGVAGDVHAGATVRHRSRVRADPGQPNLRQVHLIHGELFDELRADGWEVEPGQMGENVTTRGLDLLGLPRGTILRFGPPPANGGRVTGSAAQEAVAGVLAAAEKSQLEPAVAEAVAALTAAVSRFGSGERDGNAEPDGRPAVVVTGLRNPCAQINGLGDGLLKKVAYADADGRFVRKAGVMGVVLRGGPVRPGDPVEVDLPPSPHEPLDRV